MTTYLRHHLLLKIVLFPHTLYSFIDYIPILLPPLSTLSLSASIYHIYTSRAYVLCVIVVAVNVEYFPEHKRKGGFKSLDDFVDSFLCLVRFLDEFLRESKCCLHSVSKFIILYCVYVIITCRMDTL